MSLVIDSSIAISWLLPNEFSGLADGAVAEAFAKGADVPVLFFSEVANTVVMAVRRRRTSLQRLEPGLAELRGIDLRADFEGRDRALDEVLNLALKHGLSAYDATYLERARRLHRPLATLDGPLRKAAVAEGVALVGE